MLTSASVGQGWSCLLRPGHEANQRSCWSEAIWWAWEDLNLRLHPYPDSTDELIVGGNLAPVGCGDGPGMGLEGFGQGGEGRTRSWLASPWRFGRYLGRRLPGPGGPRGIPGWPQAARSGGVRDAAQPGQGELPPPLPWPAGGQVQG